MQPNLRQKQILTALSLLLLLVLPTAIVGYGNFSTFFNKAFGKPYQKSESAFVVSHISSENITKGANFSLKIDSNAPKALPFRYYAAFVQFDTKKVAVSSVIAQNASQFNVTAFQNGYLIYPKTGVKPTEYALLLPPKCEENKVCLLDQPIASTISFTINGTLISELTDQQRPIKISIIGIAEGSSTYIWNEKAYLPSLKLGASIKNESPVFTSEPTVYARSNEEYSYDITATDTDKDPIIFSLACPEAVFCESQAEAPKGMVIENNKLVWKTPISQAEPYIITVYANDGKSISTQSFTLKVLSANEAYFTCTFSPAVAVRILDYRQETPLVLLASSSEPLTSAQITLTKEGTTEKNFTYTFPANTKNVLLDQNSNPALSYQFSEGEYTGLATFTAKNGQKFSCELENPVSSFWNNVKNAVIRTAQAFMKSVYASVTVGTNHVPTFTSDPMLPAASGGSSPSVSFVYNTAYSFTLRSQDVDGDPLQYTTVTKPEWAQIAVTQTTPAVAGDPSTLSIQITGTPLPKHAGSNLFSFSINDGLGHFITRTWVINIDYPDNDIPKVTIKKPTTGFTKTQGQNFPIEWDVEDRNQIVSFSIYYTKSLAANAARTLLLSNIDYKTRGLGLSTAKIPPGDYYFIVAAKDSYNPAATGLGYTALIRIVAAPVVTATPKPTATPTATATVTTTPTATPTPTPTVTDDVPQTEEIVINVTSPQNQATIKPSDFQFIATFTASKGAEIDKKNIFVSIDNSDISEKITFQPAKAKALTAAYKPATLLANGVHQLEIRVSDSNKKEKTLKVSFTIQDGTNTSEDTVNIFGFDIKKSDFIIYVAILILILLGLLLPIIMYFAYRRSEPEQPFKRPVNNPNPNLPQIHAQSTAYAVGTRPNIPLTPTNTVPVRYTQQYTPPMQQPIVSTVTTPVQPPPQRPVTPVVVAPVVTTQPVQPIISQAPVSTPAAQPPRSGLSISPEQAMAAFMSQNKQGPVITPPKVEPVKPVVPPVAQNTVDPVVAQRSTSPAQPKPVPQTPTIIPPKPVPVTPPIQPVKTQMSTPPQFTPKPVTTATPASIPVKQQPITTPQNSAEKTQPTPTQPPTIPKMSKPATPSTIPAQTTRMSDSTTKPQTNAQNQKQNSQKPAPVLPPESPSLPK